MTRLLAVVAAALALVLVPATAATAAYRSAAVSPSTVSANTLAAPGSLTTTGSSCTVLSRRLQLNWSLSPSNYETGYTVSVSINGGAPQTFALSATTTTWSATLNSTGRTLVATVLTTYRNWSTPSLPVTYVC